jgi:hypothetical protein
MVDAIIFLSVAEEALQKATWTTSPPDCWGCHGIADLHNKRWHLFRECPNKQREDIQTQFRKHAREYKAFMEATRKNGTTDLYKPPGVLLNMAQVTHQWQTMGFPSIEVAQLWETIGAAETLPSTQAACFAAIGQRMQVTPTGEKETSATKMAISPTSSDWGEVCLTHKTNSRGQCQDYHPGGHSEEDQTVHVFCMFGPGVVH